MAGTPLSILVALEPSMANPLMQPKATGLLRSSLVIHPLVSILRCNSTLGRCHLTLHRITSLPHTSIANNLFPSPLSSNNIRSPQVQY